MSALLRTAALLALALYAAPAADFGALQPQGYVSDFAGVVDPGTRAALDRYCAAVEKSTGAQIALVTVPALGGEPVEDVANLLFRKWGVGAKGKDEGVLLLLVIGERRSRLEVGYGLEPVIPDGFAGSLLRQMRPALREQQYGDALMLAAQALGARIAEAKGVRIEAPGRPLQRRQQRPLASLPWPLLAGGLLALVWLMGLAGRSRRYVSSGGGFLPGLLLGHLAGRALSGYGHGRGGFGGYDSGDSFGGFGGGDSGGGGASSDW